MTKPRKKPRTKFHAFLVEPQPGFNPTNWQQTPEHYRILEYTGPINFLGRADAWRFMHNHDAIQSGQTGKWAMYLDFEKAMFPTSEAISPIPHPKAASFTAEN